MTNSVKTAPCDAWLLPTLRALTPETSIEDIEKREPTSYWGAVTAAGIASDDEILRALSDRTHIRIANGLLVSSQARDKVPERLARRFGILPLSVSDSTLDIATSNPYDI
ncbi:MAG TPA: hypothetical protein VK481_09995, partial [Gemmatimonadaceae bacterium]|nr:hypothetical protein [Gemmatimonadaceae bacterium]